MGLLALIAPFTDIDTPPSTHVDWLLRRCGAGDCTPSRICKALWQL